MEKLSLEITQEEKYNFFASYDKLGRKEQEIWRLAVWWVKRYPCAHPRQSKIAKKAKCSREHVNRAFAKFQKMGWLYLISRGLKRSKILGIPTSLLMIDIANRQYFKRIEITTHITHSYSRRLPLTGRQNGEILTPPICIQKFGFELKDSLKMSLVPDFLLQEALKVAKDMGKQGWRPKNPGAYLAGIAINMAKERGHKLNWRSYYKTLGR